MPILQRKEQLQLLYILWCGKPSSNLWFQYYCFLLRWASPNRAFYKMHGSTEELVYKTPNPFCDNRDIYFISDVPHLVKTTRNCWSNSFAHKCSRALWHFFRSCLNYFSYRRMANTSVGSTLLRYTINVSQPLLPKLTHLILECVLVWLHK